MSSNDSRSSRPFAALLALAAICALSAALAAPAGAVSGTGNAVIVAAGHDSGRTLSGQGVKLLAGNGATAGPDNKLTLAIGEVSPAGSQPSATSSTGLVFKRGKAQVSYTDVRFDLAAGTVVGKLGGAAEQPIFRVEGAPQVNSVAGTVVLSGGKLRLIGATAANLRDELGLEQALNPKGVGMVWLSAKANPTRVNKPIASGALEWGFLTSWREYIYKELGPGSVGSITTEGGATTTGEVAKPGAFFSFPSTGGSFHEGLYGASTVLSLNTGGAVKFAKPGHCIVEIKLSNLAVKIEGANSSIVGDLNYDIDKFTGKACENQPPVSASNIEIATLNASAIVPSYANGGKTVTWANIPATLTAAAATPFAPTYKAGQALDPVTVTIGVG